MPAISFNSVLIIAGVAVLVPVVLGLVPRLPVPGAVLEVIAGIVVGPSVLGCVRVDAPVQVLSNLGLGMLLFLAGLEIDVERLREPLARLAGLAFAVSAGLGLLAALTFWLAGQATQPRSQRCRCSFLPCCSCGDCPSCCTGAAPAPAGLRPLACCRPPR
jgi:Kef-type K+ transport system membrane component KefB